MFLDEFEQYLPGGGGEAGAVAAVPGAVQVTGPMRPSGAGVEVCVRIRRPQPGQGVTPAALVAARVVEACPGPILRSRAVSLTKPCVRTQM